jgi:hypothetical protein
VTEQKHLQLHCERTGGALRCVAQTKATASAPIRSERLIDAEFGEPQLPATLGTAVGEDQSVDVADTHPSDHPELADVRRLILSETLRADRQSLRTMLHGSRKLKSPAPEAFRQLLIPALSDPIDKRHRFKRGPGEAGARRKVCDKQGIWSTPPRGACNEAGVGAIEQQHFRWDREGRGIAQEPGHKSFIRTRTDLRWKRRGIDVDPVWQRLEQLNIEEITDGHGDVAWEEQS